MLDDLDHALRTLLLDELPTVVERIEADGFDISFDVPNRETTARLTRPTLSLFLYHIQENRELRPAPWEGKLSNGHYQDSRPPVRLECYYLITAWSNEVEDEHRLLTGAARVFFRHLKLPDEAIEGSLPTDHEIRMMVAQPAPIKDIVDIWSVLDNDLKPSVRVTVTVPLDLDVTREIPLVTERRMELAMEGAIYPLGRPVDVAGLLVRDGEPVAGASVRMDGATAKTRIDGTFDLRRVRAGTAAALVAVEGDVLRLTADPPAGSVPAGELLALDLASADEGDGEEPEETDGGAGSAGGDE